MGDTLSAQVQSALRGKRKAVKAGVFDCGTNAGTPVHVFLGVPSCNCNDDSLSAFTVSCCSDCHYPSELLGF